MGGKRNVDPATGLTMKYPSDLKKRDKPRAGAGEEAPGLPGAPGNHKPAAHCCWWRLLAGFPYAGHCRALRSEPCICFYHADAMANYEATSPADVTPIIFMWFYIA